MAHLITPKEKNITPGEYHCCVDGKTPTEYAFAPSTAFDETVVDNGDGTFTTTWVMDGTQTAIFEIHFTVCCKNKLNLSATATGVGEPAPSVEVFFGMDGTSGGTSIFTAETDFSDVAIEEESAASAFYPVGPCGLHVTIAGFDMESVGDTISITL